MWEKIDEHTQRLKVFKGWIVRHHVRVSGTVGMGVSVSMVFIPDEKYEWVLP